MSEKDICVSVFFIVGCGFLIWYANMGGSYGIEQWLGQRKLNNKHNRAESELRSDVQSDDYVHHLKQMAAYGTAEEKAKANAILGKFDL